ncbi:hypothetical protein, partial [Nocardioides zeicaulis]
MTITPMTPALPVAAATPPAGGDATAAGEPAPGSFAALVAGLLAGGTVPGDAVEPTVGDPDQVVDPAATEDAGTGEVTDPAAPTDGALAAAVAGAVPAWAPVAPAVPVAARAAGA